jgi:indolepyruvate ferredoxin oxidoreductase, beta subunit
MKFNVMLAGVGGEGILLATRVMEKAANIEHLDVNGMQIHGLAQRGGSVPTHVRFGKGLHSPLIPRGEANLVFALEPIEAARACYFASKKKTNFLIDDFPIIPYSTKVKGSHYPTTEEIRKMIEPFANRIIIIDASAICQKKFGNPVFGNIMCLGIAVSQKFLPLKEKSIVEAMKLLVPHNMEENMKAFNLGLDWREDTNSSSSK